MSTIRIPPIQALLAFEALARLRSVTQAAAELNVTPSAVSQRIRQLETQLGIKMFTRADFSLSPEGAAYLERVREALNALHQVPGQATAQGAEEPSATRLRLAVTPMFSREILLPRLALFRHAYPEVELSLRVSIPGDTVATEGVDLEVYYGQNPVSDRESVHLLSDEICPVCSPGYLRELGPIGGFDTEAAFANAHLIRSPLEPWSTWFRACGMARDEPTQGAQFDDLGLVLDAAVAGFGVALMRLRLGHSWVDSGRLVRLSTRSVPSPNKYFLCWKPGTLERWECTAFVDWLRQSMRSWSGS